MSTQLCQCCGDAFDGPADKRYCSAACRQRSYVSRHLPSRDAVTPSRDTPVDKWESAGPSVTPLRDAFATLHAELLAIKGDLDRAVRIGDDSPSPSRANGRSGGRQVPPDSPQAPKLPTARPDCPLCEGVGWQYTDDRMTTVIACTCRGPETRAHHAARRRMNNASWGTPPVTGPEAKPDYVAVMLSIARQSLDGIKPDDDPEPEPDLADAIERHPANGTA